MEPGRQGFTHGGPRRLRSAGRRPLQARGPTAAEGASSRLQALPPELERGGRLPHPEPPGRAHLAPQPETHRQPQEETPCQQESLSHGPSPFPAP